MGNYFLMSKRFNKQSPEDFGLISSKNPEVFTKPEDLSQWKSRQLYDYGWGKENGYYKIPMPDFNGLVDIILKSKNDDDKFGAAAVILDDYYDELLEKCFEIFEDKKDVKKYADFFKVLNLRNPINRSSTMGKHYTRISEDFEKWKTIARKIENI